MYVSFLFSLQVLSLRPLLPSVAVSVTACPALPRPPPWPGASSVAPRCPPLPTPHPPPPFTASPWSSRYETGFGALSDPASSFSPPAPRSGGNWPRPLRPPAHWPPRREPASACTDPLPRDKFTLTSADWGVQTPGKNYDDLVLLPTTVYITCTYLPT